MMGMTSKGSGTSYPRWRILLIGLLLVVAVILTAVTANTTIQSFKTFQHENELARKGDISTIRSWMTIPYISRYYHVPKNYLYDSLHLTSPTYDFYGKHSRDHLTLVSIATITKRNINELISDLQRDIRDYHKLHPQPTPGPTPTPRGTAASPVTLTSTLVRRIAP